MSARVDEAFMVMDRAWSQDFDRKERAALRKHVELMLQTFEPDDLDHLTKLEEIRNHVRSLLPVGAEESDEKIIFPTTGSFAAEATKDTACHVDLFLYDDEDVDDLVEQGLLSTNYCTACGSKKVKPLHMHSHSLPVESMRFVFKDILSPETADGKVLLDVGSRTGAMLYCASLYLGNVLKSIHGVELSKKFCDLQKDTVQKFSLGNIDIVQGDVFEEPSALKLLQTADIIILNNVFEFFADVAGQRKAWAGIKKHVKQGATLITIPSLESSLKPLDLQNDWAEAVYVEYPDDGPDQTQEIYVYTKMV